MEGIRLNQHALQIQLPQQLFENCPLVILARCIEALVDGHAQGRGIERHLGNES
jgi:hypothetical protein